MRASLYYCNSSTTTVRALSAYLRCTLCSITFICETKCDLEKSTRIISRLPLTISCIIPADGLSGGLWLIWNDDVQVQIIHASNFAIFAEIQFPFTPIWTFGGVYIAPNLRNCQSVWDSLHSSLLSIPNGCPLMGDFNMISSPGEKEGGSFNSLYTARFNDSMGLIDIGYSGPAFTWSNRRRKNFLVRERLDRAIANHVWLSEYPSARLLHLPALYSDHNPLLLILKPCRPTGTPRFRIEHWWLDSPSFASTVSSVWYSFPPYTAISHKLHYLAKSLRQWASTNRLNLRRLISENFNKLLQLQRLPEDDPRRAMEKELLSEQESLLQKEEIFWQQPAKASWLHLSDQNTKFFHTMATLRRRRKAIYMIKDQFGNLLTEQCDIRQMITNYFKTLVTSSRQSNMDVRDFDVISDLIPTLSVTDAADLCRTPTEEELRNVLFSFGPDKAPGPDGFTARFFKKCWGVLQNDLLRLVQSFFSTGEADPFINRTNRILKNKKENAESITEYRPISLCNITFKLLDHVLAKLLALRIKPFISSLISASQTAFVPGRFIQDNFLIAHEICNSFQYAKRQLGAMAMKIDMAKAYDCMEWDFLCHMLNLYCFPLISLN